MRRAIIAAATAAGALAASAGAAPTPCVPGACGGGPRATPAASVSYVKIKNHHIHVFVKGVYKKIGISIWVAPRRAGPHHNFVDRYYRRAVRLNRDVTVRRIWVRTGEVVRVALAHQIKGHLVPTPRAAAILSLLPH